MKPYPKGIDCLWLAMDRTRNLAAFITAGQGPIPVAAMEIADEMEAYVWRLSCVSEARLIIKVVRPDDYIGLAKRGLFVFDWTDIHRTSKTSNGAYEAVAVPLQPIKADVLPSFMQTCVDNVVFSNVAFSEKNILDVRTYLRCVECIE